MPIKSRDMIDMNDPRVAQIGHPAPPWLINYADLMTELVCFFVILYALSASLNKSVKSLSEAVAEFTKQTSAPIVQKVTKDGLVITLQEGVDADALFESGKADLTPRAQQLFDALVPLFLKIDNEVVIEGHTDNVPIHTSQFASNWELSTARATRVVKYLLDAHHFPPVRLSAVGYGEFRPAAANEGPEGRGKNRRVVIFVKHSPPPGYKRGEGVTEAQAAEVGVGAASSPPGGSQP